MNDGNILYQYRKEIYKCRRSVEYFLDTYGQIYDGTSRAWVPFRPGRADHGRNTAVHPFWCCVAAL